MQPTYGLPCFEAWQYSRKPSFLDDIFTDITTRHSPPPANSPDTIQGLAEVKTFSEYLAGNQQLLQRFRSYDQEPKTYLASISISADPQQQKEYVQMINSLFDDVLPLLYKLKLHYQQPRPFQLAEVHNVKFYPYASITAACPAYPSMHACIGHVLAGTARKKVQNGMQKWFADLANDFSISRMYMGLCLPADVEAGKQLAEKILQHSEFKMKYVL